MPTLTEVGQRFEDLDIFLPELMAAGEAGNACSKVIEEALVKSGGQVQSKGVIILGTVKGDIHDIGKTLVGTMLSASGFKVFDLGVDVPVMTLVEKARQENADIVGVSALLTTTMPYMKVVIDEMKERGLRDQCIVLVGGAPLNEEFGEAVGADAYCRDAAVGVETAKKMVAIKRGQPG